MDKILKWILPLLTFLRNLKTKSPTKEIVNPEKSNEVIEVKVEQIETVAVVNYVPICNPVESLEVEEEPLTFTLGSSIPQEEIPTKEVTKLEKTNTLEGANMYKLGEGSKKQLETCHPDIQKLINEVLKVMDIVVVEGHRGQIKQEEAFRTGRSKVQWPNSKHNSSPSMAVDIAPYISAEGGIPWEKTKYFYFMAGVVKAQAEKLGIKLRWGGDFNQDMNFSNDSFLDMPHFELVE